MKNQPSKKAEPNIDPTNIAERLKVPREFWIELNPSFPGPYNSELRKYDAYNRLTPQKEVPQIHVIEYSAYQALQEKVQHLEERLEFETEFHSRANAKVESLSGALGVQKRVNAEDEIILSEQIVELEEKLRDIKSIVLDGLQNSCTCNQLGVMSICGACHAAEQIRKIEAIT